VTIAGEVDARAWLQTELGIDARAQSRLELLVNALAAENARQNLISRGSLDTVWQRHIADSAQLLTVSRETLPPGPWLDLGTGAGFPGLVIAVLQPDRPVTLVDSRRLRAEWLLNASAMLRLENVEVVQSRVEALPHRKWNIISARAFAPLTQLLMVAERFSTPETLWLLPKGAKAQHELDMLGAGWSHTFHVEQSLTDPAGGIITGQLRGGQATKPVPRVP
jgi:16S rRNA (guanine527-N7)-methyltransferase